MYVSMVQNCGCANIGIIIFNGIPSTRSSMHREQVAFLSKEENENCHSSKNGDIQAIQDQVRCPKGERINS